jgi:hypothetical protein
MKVVGLGAYSRVGKDSLANALLAALPSGLRAAKKSFAWQLKVQAHELYAWAGLREPAFYETKEGEKYRDIALAFGKTPVEVWVALGNSLRDSIYDRTWIDYVLKGTKDLDVVVIPDVRYPNECAAIRQVGGTLIKVVRPGYGPRKTIADRALVGYTGWDYVFGESGQMAELQGRATDIARWLAGGAAPLQTPAEREAALSVEKIEPWEQPAA